MVRAPPAMLEFDCKYFICHLFIPKMRTAVKNQCFVNSVRITAELTGYKPNWRPKAAVSAKIEAKVTPQKKGCATRQKLSLPINTKTTQQELYEMFRPWVIALKRSMRCAN